MHEAKRRLTDNRSMKLSTFGKGNESACYVVHRLNLREMKFNHDDGLHVLTIGIRECQTSQTDVIKVTVHGHGAHVHIPCLHLKGWFGFVWEANIIP